MIKHGSFILSGNIKGWGEDIYNMFDLAVLLKAPKEERLKRIKMREYARWGERVKSGGDMYESQQKFHDFVTNRNVTKLEQQKRHFQCPVLEIESVVDYKLIANEIVKFIYS